MGKFVLSLGFPKVAQIVEAHMELIPGPKLDETQIFIKYVLFLKQEHRALLLPILTFLKSLVVHFYTIIVDLGIAHFLCRYHPNI